MDPPAACSCKTPEQYSRDNNKNAGIAMGCIVVVIVIVVSAFLLHRYIKRRRVEAAKQQGSQSSGSLHSTPELPNGDVPLPPSIALQPRRRPVPPVHGSLPSARGPPRQAQDAWPLPPRRESCHDATPSLAPIPEAPNSDTESNCGSTEERTGYQVGPRPRLGHADSAEAVGSRSKHNSDTSPVCYTPVAINPYEDELSAATATPRIMPSDKHLATCLSQIADLDLSSESSSQSSHYATSSGAPRQHPLGLCEAPFPASYTESCRRECRRGSGSRRRQSKE